jgi:hypothetical protein
MRLAIMCTAMALLAGCGSAAGTSSTSTGGGNGPPKTAISGVYLRHGSSGGHGVAGVRIGLYLRPIVFGPVMADPPHPIQVVRTGPGGAFTFTGLRGRRYFVASLDHLAYTVGKWARPGMRITISGCTTCPRPL